MILIAISGRRLIGEVLREQLNANPENEMLL